MQGLLLAGYFLVPTNSPLKMHTLFQVCNFLFLLLCFLRLLEDKSLFPVMHLQSAARLFLNFLFAKPNTNLPNFAGKQLLHRRLQMLLLIIHFLLFLIPGFHSLLPTSPLLHLLRF